MSISHSGFLMSSLSTLLLLFVALCGCHCLLQLYTFLFGWVSEATGCTQCLEGCAGCMEIKRHTPDPKKLIYIYTHIFAFLTSINHFVNISACSCHCETKWFCSHKNAVVTSHVDIVAHILLPNAVLFFCFNFTFHYSPPFMSQWLV